MGHVDHDPIGHEWHFRAVFSFSPTIVFALLFFFPY
jgi:hypothetical protein